MSAAPPVTLGPLRTDDLPEVGLFLHAHLNPRLSAQQWADSLRPAWETPFVLLPSAVLKRLCVWGFVFAIAFGSCVPAARSGLPLLMLVVIYGGIGWAVQARRGE